MYLPNVYIVGAFGVGKSTIGRELAKILNREFYDTDRELEKQLGVDIGWMLDIEGEEKFLRRELLLLQELVQIPNIVLSTGGTTVLLSESRQLLAANGTVIGLSTSVPQQILRIKEGGSRRPFLNKNGESPETELETFCHRYDSLYREIAEVVFSSESRSPKSTAALIAEHLEKTFQR